jgi:hypothetical protein
VIIEILAMRTKEVDDPKTVEAWLTQSTDATSADALEGTSRDNTASRSNSEIQLFDDFNGPKMITFDGDQTLYSDGANFDSNPSLARYLYQLLRQGVVVTVVTAAGYEYNADKYEFRLSGLLNYFKAKTLSVEECERFMLFGGECNYLLHVSFLGTTFSV